MEQQVLKKKIYKAVTSKDRLNYFEKWLYSGELEYQIESPLICDLFEFPYQSKDALYEFKKLSLKYADEEEYNFFRVKNLLQELIDEFWNADSIFSNLSELPNMYEGRLAEFIQYEYCVWDPEVFGSLNSKEIEVKQEADQLLRIIKKLEIECVFSLNALKTIKVERPIEMEVSYVQRENTKRNKKSRAKIWDRGTLCLRNWLKSLGFSFSRQ